MKFFLFLACFFRASVLFATDIPSDPHIYDEKPGPHGGKVMHVHHRNFEVSRKATQKMLDVYMPKSDGAPPKNLQMTLLKSGKSDQTLKLEPVPSDTDDQFYHYQAMPVDTSAVPGQESQAAFGFSFDLDPKKKE